MTRIRVVRLITIGLVILPFGLYLIPFMFEHGRTDRPNYSNGAQLAIFGSGVLVALIVAYIVVGSATIRGTVIRSVLGLLALGAWIIAFIFIVGGSTA